MYTSVIDIVEGDIRTEIDNEVCRVIRSLGISVDKEELIRALEYDRDQYRAGYSDGVAARDAEIVRCKDCKWWKSNFTWNGKEVKVCVKEPYEPVRAEDFFCKGGERSDND